MQPMKSRVEPQSLRSLQVTYSTKHLYTEPQSSKRAECYHVPRYNVEIAYQAMELYLIAQLRHGRPTALIA